MGDQALRQPSTVTDDQQSGLEPAMRAPRSTTGPLAATAAMKAIDFDRYIPTLLSRVTGRLRASANIFFGERYGLTLLEWRIIAFVAAEGPSSAYTIWNSGGLDKAAVTRSLRRLQHGGLITVQDVPDQRRRKTAVTLTRAGRALHAATFDEVLLRHQRLVCGLSADAVETFMQTLFHLERQIDAMADGPTQPGPERLPVQAAVNGPRGPVTA